MKYKINYKLIHNNIHCMISSFFDIIDGTIVIVTLGFYNPNLSWKYLFWHSDYMNRKYINESSKN